MGTKTITPRTHNDGQIGSSSKYWNKGYFNELNANTLNLTTLELSGVLAVSEGGTGASTHTSNCILVGDAGNAIKSYTDLRYYTDTETLKIGDLDNGPATIERHAGFNSPLGDLDIKAPIPYAGSTNFAGGNLNLHAGASSGNQNGGKIQFWASQPNVGSGTTIRNTSIVATIGYGGLYLAENSGNIIFEGSTPNNFETTLLVTDPTVDRTITFPDASGTVALTSGITNTTLNGTTVGGVATYASANTLDINAKFTWDGDDLVLSSATNQKPNLRIITTANTNKPTNISFEKDDGAANTAADYIGTMYYRAQNSANAQKTFCIIQGGIGRSVAAGQEIGRMQLKVGTSNGSAQAVRQGIDIQGHATNDCVSTVISYGLLSTTTISGSLVITSSLTFDSVALNGIQTSSESFADNDTSLMTSAAIDDRINASTPTQKGWLQWYYYAANLSVVDAFYTEKWNDEYAVGRQFDISSYTDTSSAHWRVIRACRIVPYDVTLTKFMANVEHSGTEDQVEVALWKGVLDDSSVQSSSATTAIAHLCTLTFDGDADGGTVFSKTQSQSTTSFNSTSLGQGDYLFVTLRRTQSNDGTSYHVHSTALFNY